MTTNVPVRLLPAVMLLCAACQMDRAEAAAAPRIRVALAPAPAVGLSGIAWRALVEECTRIWAREGIALTWDGNARGAQVVLPIAFDERQVRAGTPKRADAFAITQFIGRSQRIVVSIANARDVVRERRGHADSGDATTLDIVMGVMLGRVVAHEIGHALLLSTRHAPEGLMRATFDSRDARPTSGGEFALSHAERERLATRFSTAEAPVRLAGVTSPGAPPVPSPPRALR